ncbi:hypothetical protein ABID56_001336 [Alkalibacillus flavidus]|uniref:Uncharacterized protein n=1 Tax=Alkalibacillus flavidus TaxID=546021 RepID=A0ABV2KXG6_9BACI
MNNYFANNPKSIIFYILATLVLSTGISSVAETNDEEGLLELDPVVKEIYGEELYNFFVYGMYMNNERILEGELIADDFGITGNSITNGDSNGMVMAASGCSWSNFGKSLVGGAVAGGATGAVGGAAVGGVGAGPGAGVGAIGGTVADGAQHFTTCWW